MGIIFILLSALALAFANLFLRRGLEMKGAREALITLQLFFCFVIALLLCPVSTGVYTWSWPSVLLGTLSGISIAIMISCFMRALELGPAGLTIAIQNASMLLPPLLLYLFLDPKWGMIYGTLNAVGSLLVLIGLFWAARTSMTKASSSRWLLFALATFFFNLIFLTLTQWRGIHVNPPEFSLPFLAAEDALNPWYMPAVYFTSTLIIAIRFFTKYKRNFLPAERRNGSYSGLFTGVGIFFLIKATEYGTRFEQAIIYPLFAVAIIVLCNIWGILLYKERVNWWANALACVGILIGAFDWSTI